MGPKPIRTSSRRSKDDKYAPVIIPETPALPEVNDGPICIDYESPNRYEVLRQENDSEMDGKEVRKQMSKRNMTNKQTRIKKSNISSAAPKNTEKPEDIMDPTPSTANPSTYMEETDDVTMDRTAAFAYLSTITKEIEDVDEAMDVTPVAANVSSTCVIDDPEYAEDDTFLAKSMISKNNQHPTLYQNTACNHGKTQQTVLYLKNHLTKRLNMFGDH